MRPCCKFAVLTLYAVLGAQAADRSWVRSDNGSWNTASYWDSGVPLDGEDAIFTNVFTGYINLNGTNIVNKIRVANPDNTTVRLFRGSGGGAGYQAVNFCEFVKGRVTLNNNTTIASPAIQTTSVGMLSGETAWLTLTGTAVFSITNKSALYVGTAGNARGQVTVKDTAKLNLSQVDATVGLSVGQVNGSVGSFVQEGGTVQGYGRTFVGYNTSYGAYELEGGALDLLYSSSARYRIGAGVGATGLFYQRGGTVNVGTNSSSSGRTFEICGGNENAAGIYYADGGVARFQRTIELLSGGNNANTFSYGELTVDRAGIVKVGLSVSLRPDNGTSVGTSVLNLNRGGMLQTPNLLRGVASLGQSYLNGDGGTLEISAAQTTLFSTLSPVILYQGGLSLSNTAAVTITGTWRGPEGYGVSGMTMSAGGSGYLAPPRVVITGGGGSNATAIAFIDHDAGAVTGVVVTCRGEGYGAGDTLTVSISGGGGSNATATATLAANQAGPFKKLGSGVTSLAGNKTYTGETLVNAGTLLVNGTNTDGGTFTVAEGAVLGGTGAIAPKAGASVLVNGSLAPGAVGACGTLTFGSAGQATSLTLNNDLTAGITLTSNDCVTVFGDVTFGAGATVTVSASGSSVWTSRAAKIPLLTYTGTLSGTPQKVLPPEAFNWVINVNTEEKTVYLGHKPGTLIRVY